MGGGDCYASFICTPETLTDLPPLLRTEEVRLSPGFQKARLCFQQGRVRIGAIPGRAGSQLRWFGLLKMS